MTLNMRVRFYPALICAVLICSCMGGAASYANEPGSETSGKCQVIKPGEVPQGLDKTAWNKINAQIKDAEMAFQVNEKGGFSAQNSGKELKMHARKKGFDVSFRDMPCLDLNAVALEDSTGMTPLVVKDNIEFIDEDMEDLTGISIETPWDKEGADVLLIHNAGEILAWPENPGAFAIILEAAGISWTLSSDLVGYDGINYGVWYDDVQFARVALKHAQAAKKLGVKKIVIGECGHAHKAMTVIADRIFTGEYNIPRESSMTLLEDIVMNDRIKLDPSKNDFPITLHDPCNLVRLMGIVEPQRRVIRKITPPGRFREMHPHGVYNYCCGGGSGFAIMSPHNFQDWRISISGRKKLLQILDAFKDEPVETNKYLCAPCSNCKGQLRDLMEYYKVYEKSNIYYGGLVELIVNAMPEIKQPFIDWEWH